MNSLDRLPQPSEEEPQWQRNGIWRLFRKANAKTVSLTVIAVAIVFLPTALLAALRGASALKSLLLDPAAMSRFFLIIPVLILAWPPLLKQLDRAAWHFPSEKIIQGNDQFRFQKAFLLFRIWRDSRLAKIAMVILTYALVQASLPNIRSGTLLPWCYNINGTLSPAGLWYVFVSLPLVIFLVLRWCWCQLLWALFLGKVARMDLNLIPSHPDRAAGLMFVTPCILANFPYAFAIGALTAGGLANQILRMHKSPFSFKEVPLFSVIFVLVLCAGPTCVFLRALRIARVRGTIGYGTIAIRVGRQFEQKWLTGTASREDGALQVPDFSALTDLYSVVANVHNMRLVPLDFQSIIGLIFWVLVPDIPVLLAAVPFDVVLEKVTKLFF